MKLNLDLKKKREGGKRGKKGDGEESRIGTAFLLLVMGVFVRNFERLYLTTIFAQLADSLVARGCAKKAPKKEEDTSPVLHPTPNRPVTTPRSNRRPFCKCPIVMTRKRPPPLQFVK